MPPNFSQQYCFFKQPSSDDPVLCRYYLQVINVIHQYDISQANELSRHRLLIDEEREEAREFVRHVRWAEETVEIPRVFVNTRDESKGKKNKEENSDDELYGDNTDQGLKDQFPESSKRSTILSLTEQPNGAVICEDPDEPFQELETEEEKFELPFPKRGATDDFLKENEEEFVVPFPRPRKRQREN